MQAGDMSAYYRFMGLKEGGGGFESQRMPIKSALKSPGKVNVGPADILRQN